MINFTVLSSHATVPGLSQWQAISSDAVLGVGGCLSSLPANRFYYTSRSNRAASKKRLS